MRRNAAAHIRADRAAPGILGASAAAAAAGGPGSHGALRRGPVTLNWIQKTLRAP